eukprot:3933081-Rhodomonas_salina.1
MTETARGRSRRPSPSGPPSSLLLPPPPSSSLLLLSLPPPRHPSPPASPLHLTAPHSLCLQSPSVSSSAACCSSCSPRASHSNRDAVPRSSSSQAHCWPLA